MDSRLSDKKDGRVLESLLKERSNVLRLGRAATSAGIAPFNSLEPIYTSSNDVNCPSVEGIVPCKPPLATLISITSFDPSQITPFQSHTNDA